MRLLVAVGGCDEFLRFLGLKEEEGFMSLYGLYGGVGME
jgi:hypothetical protein